MNFEGRVNRVDFKNFDRENLPQHVVVNIVFVDKSHEGLFPLAYQMIHDIDYKDDYLISMESSLDRLDHSSFLALGDVEVINKNEKLISLTGGNSIRYQHLVVISHKNPSIFNSHEPHEEFAAALRTLIHAMRTKKSVPPNEITVPQPSDLELLMHLKCGFGEIESKGESEETSSLPQNMRRVFYTQMLNDSSLSYTVSHEATGRRLYELQL